MMWLYLGVLLALLGLYFLFRWQWEKKTVTNLPDKYVLITGCDSGFGKVLARQLDRIGMRVLATCLTEKGAEQLKEASSQRLQTVILDVANSKSVTAMAQWVKTQVGEKGLWGLVNNAGIGYPMAPNEWLIKEDFAKVLNVNLLGMIDVTINLLPLVRQTKGRVVNVSSGAGRLSVIGGGYCPSKFAVEAFSDSLRRDLHAFGVKVSIIEPGAFNTGIATVPLIEQNMQAVWARMPKEVKESYGEQYYKAYRKMFINMATTGSSKLHVMTDCIEHAITALYPRTRYSPGWDAKTLYIPFSYFPTILVDYWLTRSFPVPGQ